MHCKDSKKMSFCLHLIIYFFGNNKLGRYFKSICGNLKAENVWCTGHVQTKS